MRKSLTHGIANISRKDSYFNSNFASLLSTSKAKVADEMAVELTVLLTMVEFRKCYAATETRLTMTYYISKPSSKKFNDLSRYNGLDIISG